MPTTDFIHDACDILDKGEADYVLMTLEPGRDGKDIRITSSMNPANALLFQAEIEMGHVSEKLHEHLSIFYNI